MPQERGARDRRSRVPVEGGANGAADTFDGNWTNNIVSWLYADLEWEPDVVAEMLDQLMSFTARGHLAWVVFPPQGYRL